MRTLNSAGTQSGTWSGVQSFVPSQAALGPPTLTSPINGSNLVGPPYLLPWSGVGGAGAYQIKISTDPNFATTITNDQSVAGTATSYTYNSFLAWGTTHYRACQKYLHIAR